MLKFKKNRHFRLLSIHKLFSIYICTIITYQLVQNIYIQLTICFVASSNFFVKSYKICVQPELPVLKLNDFIIFTNKYVNLAYVHHTKLHTLYHLYFIINK